MGQGALILLALVCCAGCAHVPPTVADAKSATWGTVMDPEAKAALYRDDLDPNSPLVTSSGLECEHCNVAEFSREEP